MAACCRRSPGIRKNTANTDSLGSAARFLRRNSHTLSEFGIAILFLNEAGAQCKLKRLGHIAGARWEQIRIFCFDLIPWNHLCLLHPTVVFLQLHTHWLMKIRQTDLPIAVSIHTYSLHVQGFCLILAVFLAFIIPYIDENVQWCITFWAIQ